MKDLTEVIFILDRSGSMSGLEKDTIGGFNSMIEQQKEKEGDVIVSTVLFDNNYKILHDRLPIQKIKPLTNRDYYVGGTTALLDAIGRTIHHIGNVHRHTPKEKRPVRTLIVITTDGMENASTEYSYSQVKAMIERQKSQYDWEFIFLGANIDVDIMSSNLGISKDRAVKYCCDSEGTELNFKVLDKVVTCLREDRMNDYGECLSAINMDFKARNK